MLMPIIPPSITKFPTRNSCSEIVTSDTPQKISPARLKREISLDLEKSE